MNLAQPLLKMADNPEVVDNAVSLYLTMVEHGPKNSLPVQQVISSSSSPPPSFFFVGLKKIFLESDSADSDPSVAAQG